MILKSRAVFPVLLACVAVSAMLSGSDVWQAAADCRAFSANWQASQVESNLEHHTQESSLEFCERRAGDRGAAEEWARKADQPVFADIQKLASLPLAPEVKRSSERLRNHWIAYARVRDAIIAERPKEPECEEALRAFRPVRAEMQRIKSELHGQAEMQSAGVERTLARCGLEILFFIVLSGAAFSELSRIHRERQRTLDDLTVSHTQLKAARDLEQHRAEVLELLSRHAPLADTLDAVVQLVPRSNQRAGAGIWLLKNDQFELEASANVGPACLDPLRSVVRMHDLDKDANPPSIPLHNGAGQIIGVMKLFFQEDAGQYSATRCAGIAQLAALVVENQKLYDRLAFQAQHDNLTGLTNRILFQDRLQQAIRLARHTGERVAVIWLDLDRYKQVNDTYGHDGGDRVLKEIARRLQGCVRESDTVARVGGDEFGIVLGNILTAADAETIVEKIMEALAVPCEVDGREVSISVTCGISIYPEHGKDDSTLIRNADLAMCSGKRAGRNAWRTFVPQLAESLKRRFEIETEMARALREGGLRLVYQPVVDRSGRVASVEALCRWEHPALGSISPAEFIPIAEESGLIWRLGEWVIRSACREGARWMAQDYDLSHIAVNVSPHQLAQPEFSGLVARALAESGYPARKLTLELTESVFMTSPEAASRQIDSLRKLGVRFAIDDFGTGYSSLSRLAELPIDVVKIDRSFISGLANTDTGYRTLVHGIIGLAHSLQLKVVAEGVETETQLRMLRSMDCDLSQGFLLHRPMTSEAVLATLAEQRSAEEVRAVNES